MSKVTKRKITLESSSDKSGGSSRRQSVFERLGTKSVTVREAGEGFCRHWKQNGTCPYGKACIFVSTHTLISPSKRVPKIDANSESKQGGDGWDIASLEYEDERALERRRLLLQRELKRQMRRERPTADAVSSKASASVVGGAGASSSSSSGSSSSSDSSSSDSSDSTPPARTAPALPATSSRPSRSPPPRGRAEQQRLTSSSGKPMHKERSRDKSSRSATRPSGRGDRDRQAGRRTSPPPLSRSRTAHSPARSSKTGGGGGGSRHGGGQSSPARPSSKRSVSLERRDKHKRSLSPRPRAKTNKERSPRRQERGGGGSRRQQTAVIRDERKKDDDRPRLKDRKPPPPSDSRDKRGEHEDARARDKAREREREEALERCRERQREREREQQLAREKERTREREAKREGSRKAEREGGKGAGAARGEKERRADKQRDKERGQRDNKDAAAARSFDRNLAEVGERSFERTKPSERRRADHEERVVGGGGKEQGGIDNSRRDERDKGDRYHSPYDRTRDRGERGRFAPAESEAPPPQQQLQRPPPHHHRRNRGGGGGGGGWGYDEPKRDWEFNEWDNRSRHGGGGGGGEWGVEAGGDDWGAGGGGRYGGGEQQQWGGGGDWPPPGPADWPHHQPNLAAATPSALQAPPQPLDKSGRGRQGHQAQAEKEAAEHGGGGGTEAGSLKRARPDEVGAEAEAKRPRLEEALSDISDDPDEILNREDLEPEPQDGMTQEPEHRRAGGEEDEAGLGFEEISDEELDEASEANRGACADALGVDWASLVRESRNEATTAAAAAPGSALRRWSPLAVFARIGVSLRYAGKQVYEEINRRLKESTEEGGGGEGLAHPVAALHVSLRARAARRRTLFADLGARALSARHDIALRRELCGLPVASLASQQRNAFCQPVV